MHEPLPGVMHSPEQLIGLYVMKIAASLCPVSLPDPVKVN